VAGEEQRLVADIRGGMTVGIASCSVIITGGTVRCRTTDSSAIAPVKSSQQRMTWVRVGIDRS
jgi:hypothetical protein